VDEGASSGWTAGRRDERRAPRLGPTDRIAPYMTRGGRFRKIDPLRPRPRPTIPKILGVVGWAVLLGESMRRARKAVLDREEDLP
jgi:hypothetical protein